MTTVTTVLEYLPCSRHWFFSCVTELNPCNNAVRMSASLPFYRWWNQSTKKLRNELGALNAKISPGSGPFWLKALALNHELFMALDRDANERWFVPMHTIPAARTVHPFTALFLPGNFLLSIPILLWAGFANGTVPWPPCSPAKVTQGQAKAWPWASHLMHECSGNMQILSGDTVRLGDTAPARQDHL